MPQLNVGGHAPHQSTPTSCGAAALVMARALVDPGFAAWLAGDDLQDEQNEHREGGSSRGSAEIEQRWATAQAEVVARTNSVTRRPGLMQVPWPVSLGTPPWGARSELERSGSAPGVSYEIRGVRFASESDRGALFDGTISRVGVGRPVLLYAGNTLLPRHIVLWARPEPGTPVVQYDPGDGSVTAPHRAGFVGGRLGLSGWHEPWFLIRPDPVVWARESSRFGLRLPQPPNPAPGIA